jgi:hypothetical protein
MNRANQSVKGKVNFRDLVLFFLMVIGKWIMLTIGLISNRPESGRVKARASQLWIGTTHHGDSGLGVAVMITR